MPDTTLHTPPLRPGAFPSTAARAGLTGFPSPAENYAERTLDLNECLVKHPAATFFMRVEGHSMQAIPSITAISWSWTARCRLASGISSLPRSTARSSSNASSSATDALFSVPDIPTTLPSRSMSEASRYGAWCVRSSTSSRYDRTGRLQQLLRELRARLPAEPGRTARRRVVQQRWLCHRPLHRTQGHGRGDGHPGLQAATLLAAWRDPPAVFQLRTLRRHVGARQDGARGGRR